MFHFSGWTAVWNLQYIAILLFRKLAQICLANLGTHADCMCVCVSVCKYTSVAATKIDDVAALAAT